MSTKGFKILLAIALAVSIGHFCHRQTDGFTRSRITSALPFHAEWETPPLKAEEQRALSGILNQPFLYLGKGAQCYAFVSQDQQYVLKFFRHHRLQPPFWVPSFPLPSFLEIKRQAIYKKGQDKQARYFKSCKLAYERLREETGLVYLHLNKTDHLHQSVAIVDKLHIEHVLNLDEMEFMLQKKAQLIYPMLEEWIAKKETARMRASIDQILHLLLKRCQRGLSDKDPDLRTNFGFVDNQIIQFDVGRFSLRKNRPLSEEIIQITSSFKKWLEERDPSLALYLQEQIEEHAQNF